MESELKMTTPVLECSFSQTSAYRLGKLMITNDRLQTVDQFIMTCAGSS
jgi:hypothetical protein